MIHNTWRRGTERMLVIAALMAVPAFAGSAAVSHAPPTAGLSLRPAEPPAEPPAPPPEPPTTTPAEKDAAPAAPPPDDNPLPNLDDILGTGGDQAPSRPTNTDRQDLDQLLSAGEMGSAFAQTIGIMRTAADRIGGKQGPKDTGLGTQRLQEEAIARLDQLIASLEQMQQQSSQSSQQSEGDPNQQPNQQNRSQRNEAARGDNQGQVDPPGRQDGPLRPGLESARAAWGALPPRVRQLLLQGSTDRFSSLYESMTEAYYKRLAEQGSKP